MAALTLLIFLLLLLGLSSTATCHRRLLHQPFFPVVESNSPTPSPSSSPLPKMPFSSGSSSSPSPPDNTTKEPFFPSMKPTPPPPSPTALTSFPANISSILFPQPSSTSPHRHVITIAASVSVSAVLLFVSAATFLLYRRRHKLDSTTPAAEDKASRTDSLRLFPPNTVTSDAVHKQRGTENLLYLGTLSTTSISSSKFGASSSRSDSPCQKLGSPELTPLPKHNNFRRSCKHDDEDEDDEFFSPRCYRMKYHEEDLPLDTRNKIIVCGVGCMVYGVWYSSCAVCYSFVLDPAYRNKNGHSKARDGVWPPYALRCQSQYMKYG